MRHSTSFDGPQVRRGPWDALIDVLRSQGLLRNQLLWLHSDQLCPSSPPELNSPGPSYSLHNDQEKRFTNPSFMKVIVAQNHSKN
ncbi:hypothetical protein ACRRTK_012948 [Alexandromys fortis]